MRFLFRLLSLTRDLRAISRGPRAVVARQSRKALYKMVNRIR